MEQNTALCNNTDESPNAKGKKADKNILYDFIVMNTCYYILIQTHRTYITQKGTIPECK